MFVTGLELWQGRACVRNHFRQRIWGSASMAKAFFADKECWREHLMLDPKTGMDPENVRIRAAQGFEAADNFIATYWVWSKMIENLADVGYDGSLMSMMAYDWRLGYEYLEKRDGYFTKLKHMIEAYRHTTGEKVVLISHSMGGTVAYYFFQWVVADEKVGGGGGGKMWVDHNIHSFINIAGTLLGVPKAMPALLSGELKDTAVLFSQVGEIVEKYFGRRWRRNLWITWGSLFGMLPKGGDAIWGSGVDLLVGPQDENGENENGSSLVSESSPAKKTLAPAIVWNNGTAEICPASSPPLENATPSDDVPANEGEFTLPDLTIPASRTWSMEDAISYIFQHGESSSSIFSPDFAKGWKTSSASKEKRKHWHDPLATALPRASSMNIYCLYGTGVPTERAYYYKVNCANVLEEEDSGEDENQTCSEESETQEEAPCNNTTIEDSPTDEDEPAEAPFLIDTNAKDDFGNIQSGVASSDGDATVPLVSLGYMCQKWAEPKNKHNPFGTKVYTRERKHKAQASLSDPGRGGPSSGEHVDILGNLGVIEDVVRIATGFELDQVDEDIIVSDLKRIVKEIDEHGGSES